MSQWIIPVFVLFLLITSFVKNVNAYNAFTKGISDGIHLVPTVFPSLMSMILLINLLDCAEVFELFSKLVRPLISFLPTEIIAMCFLRPVSGSASLAMMVQLLRTFGPDSLYGIMASVIQGSTDTTFYVIALYFTSVGIKKIKNALWIGLFADLVGISIAVFLSVHFF